MRPDRYQASRAIAALLAFSLLLAAACSIHERTRSAVEGSPPSSVSVCVLFVDGLSDDAFSRLLALGALPTLKRELVDRGLRVETAVASVPSETYPNLSALLTGLFPGHHGIPANIWLDRRLRLREAHTNIFRSYSASEFLVPEAKTLYERLPPGSVAVTAPIARGATVTAKNILALIASYVRNDWVFLDRKTLDDVGDAYAGAAAAGRLPPLVWAHLVGADEVAHYEGPDSPAFRAMLGAIDRSFARLVRRLVRRKVRDRILFVLLGDHGNAPYTTVVDAEELVHRALFSHPTSADCRTGDCYLVPSKGARSYDIGDAEIAVGAYRGAMIWLPATRPPQDVPQAFRTRKGKGRKPRPPSKKPMQPASAFAAALAHMPEIELVVTRGSAPGHVDIYGRDGRSEIIREEMENHPSRYAYRVVEGHDPLAYPPELIEPHDGLLFRSAADWLALTAHTEYPDLVVQLPEFFDATRAPDVYVSPRPGVGFREARLAGHGGLSRLETVVPLIFAGPRVAPGRIRVARTIDLAPTILSYLGIPYDAAAMDGDDLKIAGGHP